MTQEQLNAFIYSCLSFANTAHFDEERYLKNYLDKRINECIFEEVIMRNYHIATNEHFGVCFTMSCYVYHLLYTMGIDSGYYLLDSTEKKTGYSNFVLLFKVGREYRICDLAAQIQKVEELHHELFLISMYLERYDKEKVEVLIKELANPNFINQSLEDYLKEYNGGLVIDAKGINDDRIFSEIPEISLIEFLKRELKGQTRK